MVKGLRMGLKRVIQRPTGLHLAIQMVKRWVKEKQKD